MTPFRGNMAGAVHNYPFITGTTAECKIYSRFFTNKVCAFGKPAQAIFFHRERRSDVGVIWYGHEAGRAQKPRLRGRVAWCGPTVRQNDTHEPG